MGDGVAFGFCGIEVEVAGASALGRGVFEVEGFEILIDFCAVVLVAGSGADDVTRLDVVFDSLGDHLGLAFENEPVFVAVVVVAVEPTAFGRNAEDAGTCDLALVRAIAGLHRSFARSYDWHSHPKKTLTTL